MLNKFEVEDMTYLADNFPGNTENGELHHAQKAGKPIHMKLLFVIPHPLLKENEIKDPKYAYIKDEPVRIVSITVPRGLPIYRIRHLIKHLENELRQTYIDCKRLNFVLIRDQDGDTWEHSFDLPTFGVAYV